MSDAFYSQHLYNFRFMPYSKTQQCTGVFSAWRYIFAFEEHILGVPLLWDIYFSDIYGTTSVLGDFTQFEAAELKVIVAK